MSTLAVVEEILRDERGRACGVRTSEGSLAARLILGCDGRHSKIRPLLGLAEKARLISFSVAMRLPGSAPHLPVPGYGHIFLGAWGPMLIYPIGGEGADRSDARGCFDVTADLSGGPKGAAEIIRRDYAAHLPPQLRQALLESLDREPPQIAANEAIRTDRAVYPGAAIIGDAGGCSHPLTATGMTVGFTDAQRLARLLATAGQFTDEAQVDAALRRYEVERYRFVRARELLADALYEVFRAAEPGTRAIREGILYWNTVMGRTFVEVVNAPAGRHAPDPDLNIIEWINEDDAGFAYADAQVDPRTGEVLHAQVFLTSGWAVYSREQAFRLAVQIIDITRFDSVTLEHDLYSSADSVSKLRAGIRDIRVW
mgnify:CR=1 FL=1